MHLGDQVRACLVEDLGAALQLGCAVVLHREVLLLEPGAGGAVEDPGADPGTEPDEEPDGGPDPDGADE